MALIFSWFELFIRCLVHFLNITFLVWLHLFFFTYSLLVSGCISFYNIGQNCSPLLFALGLMYSEIMSSCQTLIYLRWNKYVLGMKNPVVNSFEIKPGFAPGWLSPGHENTRADLLEAIILTSRASHIISLLRQLYIKSCSAWCLINISLRGPVPARLLIVGQFPHQEQIAEEFSPRLLCPQDYRLLRTRSLF